MKFNKEDFTVRRYIQLKLAAQLTQNSGAVEAMPFATATYTIPDGTLANEENFRIAIGTGFRFAKTNTRGLYLPVDHLENNVQIQSWGDVLL